MDKEEIWNIFIKTGDIEAYILYRELEDNNSKVEIKEKELLAIN
jgi:hypothetical protein